MQYMHTKKKTTLPNFFLRASPIDGILTLVVFASRDQTTGVVDLKYRANNGTQRFSYWAVY